MDRVAAGRGEGRTFSDHLAEHPDAAGLLDAVRAALATIGPTDEVVSRSEAVFRRERVVVRAWAPDLYLGEGHAPLVLTFGFRERDYFQIAESDAAVPEVNLRTT